VGLQNLHHMKKHWKHCHLWLLNVLVLVMSIWKSDSTCCSSI
jgi:hypothetical protein